MIIGLIGQWDHDNFGDELIAILMQLLLNDAGVDIALYRSSPIFVRRIEEAIGRRPTVIHSERAFVEHCDSFIFCPGGYMGCSDLTDFGWKRNWRAHQWSRLAAEIRASTKHYIVLGPEIGPRLPRRMSEEVRDILVGARRALVRNAGSRKYAQVNLGFVPEVIPDFVLAVPAFFPRESELPAIPVAVHITGKFFADNFLAKYNRRALSRWVRENQVGNLCLIADQPIKEKFNRGIAEFRSSVDAANCATTVVDFTSVTDLVSVLSRTALVVSTKLHVGVTCLAYGGAVVNFSSHPKVARFSREFTSPKFKYANYFLTSANEKVALLTEAIKLKDATIFSISPTEVRGSYWSAIESGV